MSHDVTGKTPEQQETIQLLQATVEQIENILTKLNTEPVDSFPSRVAVASLLSKTKELGASLNQEATRQRAPVNKTILQDEEELLPQRKKKSQSPKIPLIIGLLIAGVLAVAVFYGRLQSPQIASVPEGNPISEIEPTIELPKETVMPKPVIADPVQETVKPPQVAKKTPSPLPRPQQTLIAAIQNEVASLATAYAEGLITGVEADFRGSRLIVQMSDDWYALEYTQKQKIANEILLRAQKLDFRKLEITDLERNDLARSPVVGQNMVIIKEVKS